MLSLRCFLRAKTRRNHRSYGESEILERRALLTVPAYSSLPGASHTILLDYDGQVVTGTSWNSYYNQSTLVAPAYDIDGNSGSFSATELARIEESWKRVAEDFRPFHVNVTTVDPGLEAMRYTGSGDTAWGVRVLVTNEANMVTDPNERTGAGGIAYINSFNWNSDTPVWVFTTGGKSIAEAASHEVGHSLGLSHDGTSSASYYTGHGSGETGWASIMGVGYYQNVTQWDRGEYFGTNNGGTGANYGSGPDDLAIMVGRNGFDYRSDDHGDTSSSASPLAVSGTAVSDSGIIETTGDEDVFSFTTGAGSVVLNIDPYTPGPNLDVLAQLYDSAGNLVATSNPPDRLAASFSLTLPAGQYFLHINGTGVGSPGSNPPTGYSDYASLGQYAITGSVTSGSSQPSLSVADVSVNEGSGTAVLTVVLAGTVTSHVSVNFATADGTATAADYSGRSGTLNFSAAGSQTVVVPITDDLLVEAVESFSLNLSGATGAVIGDGTAIVSIVDNDTSIGISDAAVTEGNTTKGRKGSGSPQLKDLVFTISLANSSTSPVSVDYVTVDGSATVAGNDYQSANGTVTFAPGETSRSITVVVVGDTTVEGDETFSVRLSNAVGAAIVNDSGTGTILDDDSGGNKGGGKGGSRGGKGGSGIIADPFWYFEGPGHEDSHHHAGHSEHEGATLSPPVSKALSRRDSLQDLTDDESGDFPRLAAQPTSAIPVSPLRTERDDNGDDDRGERPSATRSRQTREDFETETVFTGDLGSILESIL